MEIVDNSDFVVVVPWRENPLAPQRLRSWKIVRQHWRTWFPGARFVVADDGGEPFSRAASINRGLEGAIEPIVVIADADVLVPPRQIVAALRAVKFEDRRSIVQPFDRYITLSPLITAQVWKRGGVVPNYAHNLPAATWDCKSACLVMRRESFEHVQGFDAHFRGWGYEDMAFADEIVAAFGPFHKIKGPAWHLWHPANMGDGGAYLERAEQNRQRWERNYQGQTKSNVA
jgi:hypothetical protein